MNAQERDELLIRIDERTRNIHKLTEAQEQHLLLLNTHVAENIKQIAANTECVKSNSQTIMIIIWCIIGTIGTGAIGSGIYGFIRSMG